MKISVILAHPDPGSFNHAIAKAVVDELQRCGHAVHFHDLYLERFDPLLRAEELDSRAGPLCDLAALCAEAAVADAFVIVHPNWWGQPPAILKGWVDRVLRAGVAYQFVGGDNGEGVPVGLLRARAAIVFNTSNTPKQREDSVFGDPLEAIWKKCIFELCGVGSVDRRMFGVVVTSTPAEREGWLAHARELVRLRFPISSGNSRAT
jgi:NAD(P)H dehydrogenase (quinone)